MVRVGEQTVGTYTEELASTVTLLGWRFRGGKCMWAGFVSS
jgi:hypothetical protein